MFDLGGVVIDFSNDEYYAHLSKVSGVRVRDIKRTIEEKELGRLERSETDIRSFERYVGRKLGMRIGEVGWYDFYRRRARADPDVGELVKELHKYYTVAFMSNIDRTRYAYTRKILDLDDFDYRFASCYIGHRKPEPEIFRFAIGRMRIRQDEALFIDNMLENVEGARKAGLRALHFTSRRQLDVRLWQMGLY